MESTSQEQKPDNLILMSIQQLLRVVLIGALAGAVTWGVTILLDMYVFKSVVCQGNAAQQCAASLDYSSAIATVLVAGIALIGLVKLQVFRSLLVVLAASIGLWGIQTLLHSWQWQYALPVSLLLFAAAYGLFAWIARIRSFLTAAIVIVILIVVVRLTLNS